MTQLPASDVEREAIDLARELAVLADRVRLLRARSNMRTSLGDTLRDFRDHAERAAERLREDARFYREEAGGGR